MRSFVNISKLKSDKMDRIKVLIEFGKSREVVEMWFEHLQVVQANRKRGAAKAAKTRKEKAHKRKQAEEKSKDSAVCQMCKKEDPPGEAETNIDWIQCDKCNLCMVSPTVHKLELWSTRPNR